MEENKKELTEVEQKELETEVAKKELETEKEEQKVQVEENTELENTDSIKETKVDNDKNDEEGFNEPITFLNDEEIYSDIEKGTTDFNKQYKKIRNSNLLLMIPILIVMIIGVTLSSIHPSILIITIVLIVIGFVIVFKKTKTNKDKLNQAVQDTIARYFIEVDSFVLNNEHFNDIKFNSLHKLDEHLFDTLHIIKDIYHTSGRDMIQGKLDDVEFVGGDYLVKTKEQVEERTQEYIVFLGKLFVYDMKVINEGRALIYLKGKGANGPTDLEGLEKIEGVLSDKYLVYSSFDVNSILKPDVKNVLENFETNTNLIDMFISIDPDKVSVGLSYSDEVMRVPLVDQLKREALKQYKDDVEKMVQFILGLKK